jgi:hypothetical protein
MLAMFDRSKIGEEGIDRWHWGTLRGRFPKTVSSAQMAPELDEA